MPVATPAPPHDPPGGLDGGVIDDARSRQRRQRRAIAAVLTAAATFGLIAYLAVAHPGGAVRGATAPRPTGGTVIAGTSPLKAPYGLAIAPDGDLYIVDTGRNQVLRRLPSGSFQVVAGNGRRGFSGDGGPATNAELALANDSGIAVAGNGTVYIADSGNGRVRAVGADGTIGTVAGDGRAPHLILHDTPALDAALGRPAGLAIGPRGDLYIAAANLVRLTPEHTIRWVAGGSEPIPCGSVFCNPAGEADFDQPDQLAFDGAGDLFVSGASNGLLEIAAGGDLEYLGQARGDGAGEALARAPDGSVVEARRDGLARLPARGTTPPSDVAGRVLLAPGRRIRGDLDRALGRNRRLVGGRNIFIGGNGVTVGPGGAIYADTNAGNTFTAVSALVEVMPNGTVRTLWRS